MSKHHFVWPENRFQDFFLRTKFCSTFFGFGRIISKLFADNFQHVCHKRNLRLSGTFFEEKLFILTNWIFYKIFRFPGRIFFQTFGRTNSTGLSKLHSKDAERSFEQKWLLRKIKILNYFGIIRKGAATLIEIFRARLSKLHSTAREKTFGWI